jgi:Flp pilus assembly pilin Flp
MDTSIFHAVESEPRENGQTMTEYALILAVVAVVAVVVYITLGSTIASVLTTVIGSL